MYTLKISSTIIIDSVENTIGIKVLIKETKLPEIKLSKQIITGKKFNILAIK
ncbi:hypothetical protein GCM10009413_17770 [Tatumella punctata]